MGPEYFWGTNMWMFPLIGIIIILFIIFILFGKNRFETPYQKENDTIDENTQHPLDILKRRYAKGEITKDEFKDIKKDII